MTDPLDTEIRKVMGTLSDRAPMPPTLSEIARRSRAPKRLRGARRRWVAAVATVATACAVAVGVARLDEGSSTRVVTAGPPVTLSVPDVGLDTLVVSYVPPGFVLADDTTGPASDAGGPESAPPPTSSLRRTQRYSITTSGAAPTTAVIYVTVTLTPGVAQTPEGVARLVQNATTITVNGGPGVLGVQPGGTGGGAEIRWVVSPHVVVAIFSRGGLDVGELRQLADGIELTR